MQSWFKRWLSVLAVVVVAAGVVSAPARAEEPQSESDRWMAEVGPEFMKNQDDLLRFVTEVSDVLGGEDAGFVTSKLETSARSVTVVWNHPSAAVTSEIARKAALAGVSATVMDYPYSSREIRAAQERIWGQRAALREAGFELAGIGSLDESLSGRLTVEGSFTSGTVKSANQSRVQNLAAEAAAMAVDLKDGVKNVPTANRSTDTSPFYAGSYMKDQNSTTNPPSVCSNGFALMNNGTSRTITARHCRASYVGRDTSNSYGSTLTWSNIGQARVLTAAGNGRTWDGTWNQAGFTKPVKNSTNVGIGAYVCTSGGNSGVHCNIKVTAMGYGFDDGYGMGSNIVGQQQTTATGVIAAIRGDSGGPVMIPRSDGGVDAVGMIQGTPYDRNMVGQVMCGSVHDWSGAICSKTVYFTSITTIINDLSANSGHGQFFIRLG